MKRAPKPSSDVTVPNAGLAHLLRRMREEGIDEALIRRSLARAGLSPQVAGDAAARIPVYREAEFTRLACDAAGDSCFAIRAGLAYRRTETLTAYIAKYSRNLGRAIENSARYFAAVDPTTAYSLRVSGNAASFETVCEDGYLMLHHRHREYLLFGALSVMRTITRTDFLPLEIRFRHRRREDLERVRAIAGCPVRFGCELDEIVLARPTLELPVPTYDPRLRDLLGEYGRTLLGDARRHVPPLQARVMQCIIESLPGRIPAAGEVAAMLGMSRRTLARRLQAEGVGFREIVDGVREDMARSHLKNGFPIAEVAFILDYADQAGFSTAFRRWTGMSPDAFRRAAGSGGDRRV